MKTTFIVHGGYVSGDPNGCGDAFYAEILRHAPKHTRILQVCFAKEEERRQASADKVTIALMAAKGSNDIFVEIAEAGSLLEQVGRSDVIYFHGGRTLRLLEALQPFPQLKQELLGKVVAGESAGANVLGQYFYSPRADTIGQGLGILPFRIIPHYRQEYAGKLDSVGQEFQLLKLPEYHFEVFEY